MRKLNMSLSGLGLAAAVAPLAVFAANASTGGDELQTITVTAQKRAESEQSVPLSMTTFTGVALAQKAINNFFDYAT